MLGMSTGSLMVIAPFLLPLGVVTIVFTFVIVIVFIQSRERRQSNLNADETRLIQEIHQQLTKMEERIEALETIIIESDRKGVRR